ncbi:DUF3152 domain-containing protein [Myceligenerans crystallogenes]|uniref:DUF3152 domain-containing protein n=1 Tax=Myceligenerans crystallogenes TaxID=316335 RepID=UPI0031E2368D
MTKARRPGRTVLALAAVLVVGLTAGTAVTAWQSPRESYAAVQGILGVETADAASSGTHRAGAASSGTASSDTVHAALGAAGVSPAPAPGLLVRQVAPRLVREPVPEPGSGLLGDDIEVPENLSGRLGTAQGRVRAPGDGEVLRVRVRVERGLPVDRDVFADAVMKTLNDRRGWSSVDGVTFARTDGADHDFSVVLAGPDTTDELCAPLDTGGSLSCGVIGMAVLNFRRWAFGSHAWDDITEYRKYLVSHEVGHVIGHGHDLCAGKGEKATVMVQQTKSTRGCIPEPWPAPDAGRAERR